MSYDLIFIEQANSLERVYELAEEPTDEESSSLRNAVDQKYLGRLLETCFLSKEIPGLGMCCEASLDFWGASLLLEVTYNEMAGAPEEVCSRMHKFSSAVYEHACLRCFDPQLEREIDLSGDLSEIAKKYAEGRALLDQLDAQQSNDDSSLTSVVPSKPWWKFW